MTIPANMSTNLSAVTVQELLDYADFTNGLVDKLKGSFAKLNGENATDAGVTAMLGKLTDKVVTTKELTAETGKLVQVDGSNATDAGVTAMLGRLTTDKVITTSQLTAQLADKADKTALDGKANKTGSNIEVEPFSNTLAAKLVKLNGENATDAGVTAMLDKLTNKVVTDSKLTAETAKLVQVDGSNATDAGVTAMLGKLTDKVVTTKELTAETAKLVQVDGSNATDAGVTAMLGKLQGQNKVVTDSKLTEETAKLVQVDGSNATDAGVTAMLDKLTNKVVTTKELTAETAKLVQVDGSNATDAGVTAMLGKLQGQNKVVTDSKLTEETGKLVQVDGTNATDAGVTAMLDKLTNKVVTDSKLTEETGKLARLDGTNAEQGAELLNAILNVKSSTDPTQTILETRLAKAGTVDVGQFVNIDGTNIATHSDKGKALAEAILGVKVADGDSKTVIETQLDAAFQLKADKNALDQKADSDTLKEFAKLNGENIDVDAFATQLANKLAIKDGSNIADGFSDVLKNKFVLVDGSNIEESGLETKLASKFAAAGSASGEKIVEANPNDTLPDAWANLI
ncbi:hypothetical protein IC220_03810 [Wolbachia endosymbiont of Pentalonia nigronervosa]|uniref:hypothetical protein n=1 Tax=Wolbachia endosymbiont of Pentalonia nigronervosa TaxID=1301914 RepID=UPI00165FC6BC|nr:hypothetical protein [Wolbachia endosymbiont of Pentalonia nigronervosa]MBD0391576.1 hypothetical protein [Wolbachia endosymbiont of Pentalonia nigronervosa]